jgi:hypothetical protein
MSVYALGDKLGKTRSEVLAMSVDEFNGWIAFYQLRAEENGNT